VGENVTHLKLQSAGLKKPRQINLHVLFGIAVASGLCILMLHAYAVVDGKKGAVLEKQTLALQPGSTTLDGVRALVSRYGTPGDYVDQCDEKECHVSMSSVSFSFLHPRFDVKALRALGIRPADYETIIDVINGTVSRVEFSVFYRKTDGSWVRASTHVLDDFTNMDRCSNPGLFRHPEYAVSVREDKSRPGSLILDAGATKKARKDEYRSAQELNLSCATSFRNCGLPDLKPHAYRDWLADAGWEQENSKVIARARAECKKELSSSSLIPRWMPWWATGWRRNPL
jgi:hypothetical protein